jgi:hypothetical protein
VSKIGMEMEVYFLKRSAGCSGKWETYECIIS